MILCFLVLSDNHFHYTDRKFTWFTQAKLFIGTHVHLWMFKQIAEIVFSDIFISAVLYLKALLI